MERTKEQELNIVLKNYDAVKAERDALKKENDGLKAELAQQKALYKNMLDHFNTNQSKDWESKYRELNGRYNKINGERSKIIYENRKMRQMIDSVRGTFCNAHNRLEALCVEMNVSNRGEDSLSQGVEEQQKQVEAAINAGTLKQFQQQQFIKYVREMVAIYKSSGGLGGIAMNAGKYGVTALTKIQFFKYDLHEEPLTDERILDVYKEIKRK